MPTCARCNKNLSIFSKKRKIGDNVFCSACFFEYTNETENKRKEGTNQKEQELAQRRNIPDKIVVEVVRKYVMRLLNNGHLLQILRIADWPYQTRQGGVFHDKPDEYEDRDDYIHNLKLLSEGYEIDFDVDGDPFFYDTGLVRSLPALRYVIDSEIYYWQDFKSGEKDAEHYYTLNLIHVPPQEIDSVIEMLENQKMFCHDVDKLCKLCARNGAAQDHLFRTVLESIFEEGQKLLDMARKNEISKLYQKLSLLLFPPAERNENTIIRKYLELVPSSEVSVSVLGALLSKFGIEIGNDLFVSKLAKIQEDIELDAFGKQLEGTPPKLSANFHDLSGYQFEEYVKRLFQLLGYDAVRTCSSGDKGADILLEKAGKRSVVQVKKYSKPVDGSAIQQVVASKPYYSADEAIVVTNSNYTRTAVELAKINNVELIDGQNLNNMLRRLNNASIVSEEGFSHEILGWLTREQLVNEWLDEYDKLNQMGAFDKISIERSPYTDELDEFLLSYLQEATPYLDSVQHLSNDESGKAELKSHLVHLESILDQLRARFMFAFHFQSNEIILGHEMVHTEDGQSDKIPSSSLDIINATALLALFVVNLINLINWLQNSNEDVVDHDVIQDRVNQIRNVVNIDLINAIHDVARKYDALKERI